jgi:adenine phosphoribosyltransferase
MTTDERLKRVMSRIRDVPDFPKPGILFKDVTPLIGDGPSFRTVTDMLAERIAAHKPELVVGIESRGFIFGAALSERLGVGFVPVRKPGKLPWQTHRVSYDLEYGSETLEMHVDALAAGERVLLVDDVLATGGTLQAAVALVEQLGGVVTAVSVVIELIALGGRQRIAPHTVHALWAT